MSFTEPFLVNPPRQTHGGQARRGRFSFRSMLSKLGNPRRRKARKIRRHTRRARKNPLADLMIMNPKRKRRIIRKHKRQSRPTQSGHATHKKVREIISRRTGRGETTMARRKRRNAPKKHRVTLVGRRVSKHSRIARKHRGFLLNPAMNLGGLMPSGAMIQDVLGITAGYVAVKLIPKYLFPIVGITEPIGVMGTVTKVAVVVAVGLVAGFAKKPALKRALVLGGLVAIAIDLLGQTGVLADGMGGYILPAENLRGARIDNLLGDGGEDEYEDTRR